MVLIGQKTSYYCIIVIFTSKLRTYRLPKPSSGFNDCRFLLTKKQRRSFSFSSLIFNFLKILYKFTRGLRKSQHHLTKNSSFIGHWQEQLAILCFSAEYNRAQPLLLMEINKNIICKS